MGDPGVAAHIVKDVVNPAPGEIACWTGRTPTFRFSLPAAGHPVFYMKYAVHSRSLAQSGSVTLTIRLNDRQLDRIVVREDGLREYHKPVSGAGGATVVSVDVDPPWIAPADHAVLGIILYSIGFYAP
jgi:hypothetical protein